MKKSTVTEIRERFDNEVERFSNLETGQVATMDAKIALELISRSLPVERLSKMTTEWPF